MYLDALVGPCFLQIPVVSPDVRSPALLDAPLVGLVALVAHSSVHALLLAPAFFALDSLNELPEHEKDYASVVEHDNGWPCYYWPLRLHTVGCVLDYCQRLSESRELFPSF